MDTPAVPRPAAVGRIGDYIKEQRETARLSLRRLAQEAGVSNPYLSQVERGLRKPSAEILQQLAKALRISAEQLYVQAGLLEDNGRGVALEAAIVSDTVISERHKRVLLDIYASFVAEDAHEAVAGAPTTVKPSTAKRSTAKRSTQKAAQKT